MMITGLETDTKEDCFVKKIVSLVLIVVLLTTACATISGCGIFGGEGIIKNSEEAKNYLRTKYGEDFIELRDPIFTPGNNKYEYFFSDGKAPSVSFNVYEENGKFTDNYEREKNNFFLVESPLRAELEEYGIKSMIDASVYDDKSECFCYLVIEEPSLNGNSSVNLSKSKECIKEFCQLNKMAITVALFSLNEQDFAALLSEFAKGHNLNSTIVEKFPSCVHQSFVLDSQGNVLRDDMM